nr:RNA-directed DNA polymerase, eukaryota [Tanacetum cinerariifolium]
DSFGNSKVGKLYLDVAGPDGISGKQTIRNGKEESANSATSGHFKISKIPRTGGSILDMLEEMVKVGQVTGYNMEGCLAHKAKRDWVKELCCKYKVNFLALHETKMENMNLLCVRLCWGNLDFEYARSNSVGNSGGILCVWDPNSFCKHSVTCSDYFVMVRGVWRSTGHKWKGDVVNMGDFNEVRFKFDRFGSIFNAHAAAILNTFIRSSGLEEVNLRGDNSNAMRNLMDKLKDLKKVIRVWNKSNALRDSRSNLISDLDLVGSRIDKGYDTTEDVKSRVDLLIMSSDSHATITYTSMSSYEVIVNGYYGMPMDPYVQLVMEAPPSPDYIPGPEAPPSPNYIPRPVYPEYLPPADDVLPAEEQPLPTAVLPTAESPGYITKSEPEMEPEEEDGDDEKSEEDSIEYPTSEGDDDADDDGDDFLNDDADGEDEEESSDSEEEEEEHIALTVHAPALSWTTASHERFIPVRVAATMAKAEASRVRNGYGSNGSGPRLAQAVRECTYLDFLKCQTLNFKGTEGVIGLT